MKQDKKHRPLRRITNVKFSCYPPNWISPHIFTKKCFPPFKSQFEMVRNISTALEKGPNKGSTIILMFSLKSFCWNKGSWLPTGGKNILLIRFKALGYLWTAQAFISSKCCIWWVKLHRLKLGWSKYPVTLKRCIMIYSIVRTKTHATLVDEYQCVQISNSRTFNSDVNNNFGRQKEAER